MFTAYIDEMFVSLQGEGTLAGTPMLFIRFGGCSIGCKYCDTPRAQQRLSSFILHDEKNRAFANPISAADLYDIVQSLHSNIPYIAITGGEPLEQIAFLDLFLDRISETGKKVLLDSSGVYYSELSEIIPRCDIVGMDVKMPSFTGKPFMANVHKKFLEIAIKKDVYVKIVVGPDTNSDEIFDGAKIVADVAPNIPVILQPQFIENRSDLESIESLMPIASELYSILEDVRILPQIHRLLEIQ